MPVDSPLPISSPSPQRAIVGLDTELPLKGLNFARVVFLDFDGVLHPQDFTANDKFCYLANFCEVVRCVDPLHNLPLVVSSTWRHHHSLQQMRGAFPADIAAQIVGATPYMSIDDLAQGRDWTFLGGDPYKMMHRQREIRLWLHVHAPGARWLAIDDRPDYFDEGCPNLFTVPGPDATGGQGLTSEVAIDLLDRPKNFIAPALRTSGSSTGPGHQGGEDHGGIGGGSRPNRPTPTATSRSNDFVPERLTALQVPAVFKRQCQHAMKHALRQPGHVGGGDD